MMPFLSRVTLHIGARRCASAAQLRGPLQNPFASTFSLTSEAAAADAGDRHLSPAVSYLIQSCGLSPETAFSTSRKVLLGTTEKPDAVLRLLQDYGCSRSHIATMVAKLPGLLRMKSERTLKPKLEFLCEKGISGPHLARLLARNPYLLAASLEKTIVPWFDLLKLFTGMHLPAVTNALRSSPRLHPKTQHANIQTLRRHGIPDASITKLLEIRPLALTCSPGRFEESVTAVKEMGLDHGNPMFILAVAQVTCMSKATLERKLALYRSLGLSDQEISTVFVKQPICMSLSEKDIRQKMDFFTNKVGLPFGRICRSPVIMMLSLAKRIAPRCSVLMVLMSRGVLRRKVALVSVLKMPERDFVERFVTKYRDEVPGVVESHQGKVEFAGFGALTRLLKF